MSTWCLHGGGKLLQRSVGRTCVATAKGSVPAETQPKTGPGWGECLHSVGWPHFLSFTPGLALVSRWWWLCTAQEQTWAECHSREAQILPAVRRVHGSALSTALKSLLGFARSSQQHNYQIMLLNWSCRLGCQTLAGEVIDSWQTASQDREAVWSILLCSFLTRTSYDRHDRGIQQFNDIKCFIIAGRVIQPSAQGSTHSSELWMRRAQSVNTGETECSLWKHQCTEECAFLVILFLTLFFCKGLDLSFKKCWHLIVRCHYL